jgi:hypothetical protein
MFSNKPFLLKIFLVLISIETAWTVLMLFSIPSDSKNAVLFGFSLARFSLMVAVILMFVFAIFMLVYITTSTLRFQKVANGLDELSAGWKFSIIFWSLAVIFIFGVLFLLMPPQEIGEALFERLFPVVLLSVLLAPQILLFQFIWLEKKLNFNFLFQWKSAYMTASFIFLIIFVIWVLIAWSKIGIVPEKTGWAPPGTPLLPQQVLIALGFGFFFYLISKYWHWIKNLKKSDLVVGVALWLLASFLWINEPLRDWSYFTAEPTPPNSEIYPYSDAGLYDTFAQNYLIGTSLQYGLIHRPGYAIFLAFLHSIVGQNYDSVIFAQILILAIGPTALYFLASQLGGRPAAIIAALILIFREENAIALTNIIEVSHSKLFMSDVPTMILMILFLCFLIHWLNNAENKLYIAIVAGGFLGLSALIRSQALIVIPIVFLCILIAKRKSLKPAFIQSAMFLLGVLVVILPWMLRNYQISGRMVIEYQNAYTTVIASGYTDNPDDIEKLPGETVEQYDDRMFSMILNYIFENPFEVARFYTAYFVHNEISSIVYLPMSLNFWDTRDYVRQLNMWGWNPPFANPAPEILPFYFFTLGLIALGIGIAYHRTKWIGLLPLFIHLGYSLSVVPFKTSGWRFILPVDWILALYFSIGLMHLTLILFSLFNDIPKRMESKRAITTQLDYQKSIPIFSILLIIGLAFPLVEKSIPKKYPELTPNELAQTYFVNDITLENGEVITASALEMFLEAEPSSTVLYGRALYPSFYQSGEYWGDDDSYPPAMRNISRLQFLLIGPMQGRVYIPLPEAPLSFSHASDVVVIGCRANAGLQALIVNVDETIFINNLPWRGLSCASQ